MSIRGVSELIQSRGIPIGGAIGFIHGEESEHMAGIGSDGVELHLDLGIRKVRRKEHQFHSQGHGLVGGRAWAGSHSEIDRTLLLDDRRSRRY
jgi:hypothetical protein